MATRTMMAGVVRAHGGPEGFGYGEVACPRPGPGEVLVRVGACALNAFDLFVRRGLPGIPLDLPHVPGGDVAGWVEEAVSPADRELVGRQVLVDPILRQRRQMLGEHVWGGLAEFAVVPASAVVPLPGVDAGELPRYAALPVAYGTAQRMLFARAALRPGETLLVLGAAGGVGVACVQLGRRHGARVVACSTSDAKLERLRALGADATLNPARADLHREIRALTDGRAADVVVDYLGKDTLDASVRLARRQRGRIVVCGASSGYEAVVDVRYLWTREVAVLGSNGWERADLEALLQLVRRGELEPVLHRVYPLSRVSEALAEIERRDVLGKVVVVPDGVR